MNDRERRRSDAFGRAQTFCTLNAADIAAGSKAATCAANLGKITADLDAAKAVQSGGGATAKAVILDGLRLDVQNITRTARSIAQDEPGFAAQFPPPESPGQAALLTAVDAILARFQAQTGDTAATKKAKTALVAKFVAHELPNDFVQNLADDRASAATAQDTQETSENKGVESTGTIDRLIKAGMKELTTLDAIMHNKYTRNPEKLRAWQSASHIERAPQREKKPASNIVNVAPGASQPKAA